MRLLRAPVPGRQWQQRMWAHVQRSGPGSLVSRRAIRCDVCGLSVLREDATVPVNGRIAHAECALVRMLDPDLSVRRAESAHVRAGVAALTMIAPGPKRRYGTRPHLVVLTVRGYATHVLFRRFKHSRLPAITGHRPDDERAYLLLEEARLRCEALRDGASSDGERRRLASLHRELGLAGFLVSSDIPPRRRRALLELARAQSAGPAWEPSDPAHTLVALTLRAQAAIEQGAMSPAQIAHMERAWVYLRRAQEWLEPTARTMVAAW